MRAKLQDGSKRGLTLTVLMVGIRPKSRKKTLDVKKRAVYDGKKAFSRTDNKEDER